MGQIDTVDLGQVDTVYQLTPAASKSVFRLFTERLESVAKERDNNRLLKAERAKRRLYNSLAEEGSQLKISSKKKKNAPKAAKGSKEK